MGSTHWATITRLGNDRALRTISTPVDLVAPGMADLMIGYLQDGAEIRLVAEQGVMRFPWCQETEK